MCPQYFPCNCRCLVHYECLSQWIDVCYRCPICATQVYPNNVNRLSPRQIQRQIPYQSPEQSPLRNTENTQIIHVVDNMRNRTVCIQAYVTTLTIILIINILTHFF